MRLWTIPLRLLAIVILALLASGAWLLRGEITRAIRPQVDRIGDALGSGVGAPRADALARARDKVDSLQGWGADSVTLTAAEMASVMTSGLPLDISAHLDSLTLALGEGRVTISGRLETAQIPKDVLGPLAGALEPWERITAEGPVTVTRPGEAAWQVEALTLRGFTLPAEASRRLIERGLPGAKGGIIPIAIPSGIGGLRVRPAGVALYRKGRG